MMKPFSQKKCNVCGELVGNIPHFDCKRKSKRRASFRIDKEEYIKIEPSNKKN